MCEIECKLDAIQRQLWPVIVRPNQTTVMRLLLNIWRICTASLDDEP